MDPTFGQGIGRGAGNGLRQDGTAPPAGGLRDPRLAFLAAMIFNPLIVLCGLVYLYVPSDRCYAGPLCGFERFPGIAQGFLMLLGGAALWLLLYLLAQELLDAGRPPNGALGTLWRATRYETMRGLLWIYGGLVALLLVVCLFRQRLSTVTLMLSLLTLAGTLWPAFWSTTRRRTDPLSDVGTPLYRLRQLWPIRLIWPPSLPNARPRPQDPPGPLRGN